MDISSVSKLVDCDSNVVVSGTVVSAVVVVKIFVLGFVVPIVVDDSPVDELSLVVILLVSSIEVTSSVVEAVSAVISVVDFITSVVRFAVEVSPAIVVVSKLFLVVTSNSSVVAKVVCSCATVSSVVR